jgi:beta-fructofuranosidase
MIAYWQVSSRGGTAAPAPGGDVHGDIRPRFHLTPPANWMNDPNGLHFQGRRLHAFYQHNPDEPRWEHMAWGHAVTDDLVTWEHLPLAIAPSPGGPDAFGCWSGCIVEDDDGLATMFYTGVVLDPETDGRRASICRATSTDGLLTWTKDRLNPCVPGPPDGIAPDAFRDPFVWRDGDGWAMLVGAGDADGLGAVLLYRSTDLRSWTYVGPFLSTDDVARAAGADGPCWECPQLLRLDGHAVLIVSVVDRSPRIRPSHVVAFVGRIDGDHFEVDAIEQLGMGPDFYAPATVRAPDGRHLVLGWIPEDPPPEGSSRTWVGSLTFPRVVSVGGDGQVSLALADEALALRSALVQRRSLTLPADAPAWHLPLGGHHFEMLMEVEPGDADEVVIELVDGSDDGPEARIGFIPNEGILTLARRGIVAVAGRSSQSSAVLHGRTWAALHLRILVDGSILELEANGRTMATVRLPTTRGDWRAMTFAAVGGSAHLVELDTWTMAPPAAEASS